jgi:flagellar export protein FliJ
MTAFVFRLERVLRWRQAKLDLEQAALGRLAAECARWDTVIAKIEASRADAETWVLGGGGLRGGDLAALAKYQEELGKRKLVALDRRRQCERKIEEQRARLMAARREFRLLERLRQMRRVEWEAAVDREFEALAAESYLARWPQRARQS